MNDKRRPRLPILPPADRRSDNFALQTFSAGNIDPDQLLVTSSIKIISQNKEMPYFYRLWMNKDGDLVIEAEIPIKIMVEASNFIRLEFA